MLIDTVDKLESVMPDLLSCMDPCVDTETEGLDPYGHRNGDVPGCRVIGISVDTGRNAYYFPFRHRAGRNLPDSAWGFFRSYLSDPMRVYGGYNYKFDTKFLAMDGVPFAPNYEDAELALHLINENEPNFRLKDVCDRYGIGSGSREESILLEKVDGRKDRMCELPASDVEPYACDDVRLTRELLELERPALEQQGLYEIWQEVNRYSYIISRMEERGMKVDRDLVEQYRAEAEDMSERANQALWSAAGYELNPRSSKQVCAFLGVDSSRAEVLEELQDFGGEQGEAARLVLEARGWASVCSRYYDVYLESMDENDILHCNLNLIGTISGRLSCSHPNLQAVARRTNVFKVKDVFVAREGYTMVQADYRQAEMRLATFYTKDPLMTELIESGADLHSATAEQLGIPRNAAKRINFGVIYGIGAAHLADGLKVDRGTAKGYLDAYHNTYPGFRKLLSVCEETAMTQGEITMWTGRKRHYNQIGLDPHKAMSNLIQGGVAEIERIAIQKLYPAIADMGGYIIMQVHDSIMFEIPDGLVDVACRTIREIMEDFNFIPHFRVDIETGRSWGTLEEWRDGRQ